MNVSILVNRVQGVLHFKVRLRPERIELFRPVHRYGAYVIAGLHDNVIEVHSRYLRYY